MSRYDEEEKTLHLSAEECNPETLLKYKDVSCIRIESNGEKAELPEVLKEYKKLVKIYILGDKFIRIPTLYPPILNLEKLTNIRELDFGPYYNLKDLKPMPHIEILDVYIVNPREDISIIFSIFPNLREMIILGGKLESEALSSKIGEFKNLEHLELTSCGLTDLPPEIKNLKSLKSLHINKMPMSTFPEVLCEMDGLEELKFTFSQKSLTTLPDSFSNLKALKKIDFSGAFNKTSFQPLPDVIGALPALQELNLNFCSVINLDFLEPLKTLKKLDIVKSRLENCNALSHCPNLETLNLDGASRLTEIKGLAGLPIKNLNLSNCDKLTSIAVIEELQALEALNVKGSSIKVADVMRHQPANLKNVKTTEGSPLEWGAEKVLDNLSSENLEIAEEAMNDLALYLAGDSGTHLLAAFFGEEGSFDEEILVDLPVLDSSFTKHKNNLNIDTLVELFEMSLQSLTDDSYAITLLAVEEIIKRKNVTAQKKVIAQFKFACSDYDWGHRYYGSTIANGLLDDLFREFETAALIDLLEDGCMNMIMSAGEEGAAARLFVPAFQKCDNDSDFNALVAAFFKSPCVFHGDVYGDGHSDPDPTSFVRFQREVLAVLTKDNHLKFSNERKKRISKIYLFELLDSDDPKEIEQLIDELDKKENDVFLTVCMDKILEKVYDLEPPLRSATKALDFAISKEYISDGDYIEKIIIKYFTSNEKDVAVTYIKHLKTQESSDNKEYIARFLSDIIHTLNMKNHSMTDTQVFRNYLKEINQWDDNAVHGMEIEAIFERILKANDHDADFYDQVSRLEEMASLVNARSIALSLNGCFDSDAFSNMINEKRHDIIKKLCKALFPIVSSKNIGDAFYIAVMNALVTDDAPFLKFLRQYVPGAAEDSVLTYNLICAYEHTRSLKKEPQLKYIRRAIALGRPNAQISDDENIEKNEKKVAVTTFKTKEDAAKKERTARILSIIIHELNMNDYSMKEMQFFRYYLKEINQCSDDAVYAIEINSVLNEILTDGVKDRLIRLGEIVNALKSPTMPLNLDLQWSSSYWNVKNANVLKQLFNTLLPIVSLKITDRSLNLAILSALVTDDAPFFKSLSQYISETTADDDDAFSNSLTYTYNLACAYAKSSEKESMLKYIRRSIALGRAKSQFLEGDDFTQYKDDEDFLLALELV